MKPFPNPGRRARAVIAGLYLAPLGAAVVVAAVVVPPLLAPPAPPVAPPAEAIPEPVVIRSTWCPRPEDREPVPVEATELDDLGLIRSSPEIPEP